MYQIVYIDNLHKCLLENDILNMAEQIYKSKDEQLTHTIHTCFSDKYVETSLKRYYMNQLMCSDIYYACAS